MGKPKPPWRQRTITHSNGKTFKAVGETPNGTTIWPIAEYLNRTKDPPHIINKVKVTYPNGLPEGMTWPREWHNDPWGKRNG